MTEGQRVIAGRDGELAAIECLLGGLEGTPSTAAETRFLLIEGEPGIGKTTLLTECGERAARAGHVVVSGRATELERELPFGVLNATLDRYLDALPGRAFSGLAEEDLAELATPFPSLRSLAPEAAAAPGPQSRAATYRAIAALLEILARTQAVVIVLDDLQWADRSSVEAVTYLLCRPPKGRILIAAGWRRGQADPALTTEVNQATRAGVAELIELGPLSRYAAAEIAAAAGAPDSDHLFEDSGGNPFYLLELATAGGDSGAGGPIPAIIAATIASELGELDDEARATAESGAVAGDPFEVDLAARIAGLDPDVAADAIDGLVAADILRTTDLPRSFAFRHPLVREAVYASVPPGRRLRAHRACAEALAERGAAAGERAHHVEQAAEPGDDEAIAVLSEAAAESSQRAPASAARWLASALRLLPGNAPTDQRLELLVQLPALLASINEFRGARDAMLEALELLPPDPTPTRVELTIATAAIDGVLGESARGAARLERLLESIEDPASPEAVSVLIARASAELYSGDFAELRRHGLAAAEAARGLPKGPLLAAGLAVGAQGCAFASSTAEAFELLDEAAELIDDMSDEELAERLDAIGGVVSAELYLDRHVEAVRHAERGTSVGRRTGTSAQAPTILPALCTGLSILGKPREAVEVMGPVVDEARALGSDQALAWNLLNLSLAQALSGDRDAALASGVEANRLAAQIDSPLIAGWASWMSANVEVEVGGNSRRGLELMEQHNDELLTGMPGGWRCYGLEVKTRAALACGEIDLARRTVEASQAHSELCDLPLPRAWSLASAAQLALAEGDPGRSAELALAGIEPAESVGAMVDAHHCRLQAGRAYIELGDRERAAAILTEAATGFEEGQAPHMRDEAERELGRIGKRTHRRSRGGDRSGAGLASLTGRELEVARLVREELTNAQIAESLFLSEKTVESHLRNIFGKLAVTSRTQVARAVAAEADDV